MRRTARNPAASTRPGVPACPAVVRWHNAAAARESPPRCWQTGIRGYTHWFMPQETQGANGRETSLADQLGGTALDQQRPQISESMWRTVFQHHPARIKVRRHCVRIHRPAITGRDVAEADGGVIQNQNVRSRQSLCMSLSDPFQVARGFRSAVAQGIRHTPDLPLAIRRRKRLPMRERMVLSRPRDWVFKRDAEMRRPSRQRRSRRRGLNNGHNQIVQQLRPAQRGDLAKPACPGRIRRRAFACVEMVIINRVAGHEDGLGRAHASRLRRNKGTCKCGGEVERAHPLRQSFFEGRTRAFQTSTRSTVASEGRTQREIPSAVGFFTNSEDFSPCGRRKRRSRPGDTRSSDALRPSPAREARSPSRPEGRPGE